MASKWIHFTAQAHKLYPILVVPSKHLNDVAGIGETEILNVCLSRATSAGWSLSGRFLVARSGWEVSLRGWQCSRMEAMGQVRELKTGGLELRR